MEQDRIRLSALVRVVVPAARTLDATGSNPGSKRIATESNSEQLRPLQHGEEHRVRVNAPAGGRAVAGSKKALVKTIFYPLGGDASSGTKGSNFDESCVWLRRAEFGSNA